MQEIWKAIPGYEGKYEVSDQGRVRSFVRDKSGKIRKQTKNISGHMFVTLGRGNNLTVHTLVLTAFVSPKPKNFECCHNDGNPSNNCLSNLRWDTHKENARDMYRHMSHNNQKLKISDVIDIKNQLKNNTDHGLLAKLAKKYNVSIGAISCIKRGKTYAYVIS